MASLFAAYEPHRACMGALGRAINDREVIPQNLQELADALREEWDAMPVDVNKLLDSMPRRLHALVRARGGHIRYYKMVTWILIK